MRRARGAISCRNATSLPNTTSDWVVIPVMLPPGLAKLATNPLATGLLTLAMTIGIVDVARCIARVVVAFPTTIASTRCLINSFAKASRWLASPSA